jgi:hypothetical protein
VAWGQQGGGHVAASHRITAGEGCAPYGAIPQHCDGLPPFMMIAPLHNDGFQAVRHAD